MAALNLERLAFMRTLMEESRNFVQQVYYPDLLAIAGAYKEWFGYGAGVTNYLAVPEFPEDSKFTSFALAGGRITLADLEKTRGIKDHRDDYLIRNIRESAACSWYKKPAPLHPWEGQAEPAYTLSSRGEILLVQGPAVGRPTVSGRTFGADPGELRSRNPGCEHWSTKRTSVWAFPSKSYHSTMGRMLARGMRARIMADLSLEYLDKLIANIAAGDKVYTNPTEIPMANSRAWDFMRRREGVCLTGSRSRTRRSRTTRRSSPAHGMPRRATRAGAKDRMKRRSRARRSPRRISRWKSSALSTRSIPASPARSMPSIPKGKDYRVRAL